MAPPEKTDQNLGIQQVEIRVVNPNTRVKLPRTDVDEEFCIVRLPETYLGDRLQAFAMKQVETCPEEVIGGDEGRERFREYLKDRHPIDSVLSLISREPYLMLSNLTDNQLRDLIPELRKAVTDANRGSVSSAISVIQGIFIGRASIK